MSTVYELSDDDSIELSTRKIAEAYEIAEIEGDERLLSTIREDAYMLLNYGVVEVGRELNPIASDNPEITELLMYLVHGFCNEGCASEHHVRVRWARLKRAVEPLMSGGAS